MAHMIEMLDGKVSMAWAGETPWHGLGTKVPNDLTPEQMLKAANLDWTVTPVPAFAEINGKQVDIGRSALVRDRDNKILDVITNDWVPNQNSTAFEFFNDFISAGEMEMHTAGSLRDGQIVWALAKVKEALGKAAITAVVAEQAGLSADKLLMADKEKMLNLESLLGDRVIGVIDIEHPDAGFLDEHHLEILTALAALLANKLVRVRAELDHQQPGKRQHRNQKQKQN